MKKRAARFDLRSLVVALSVSLVVPFGLAQTSEPSSQLPANTDPLALLAGLTDAARSHAYRGTIVQIQGGAPVSIAVEHTLVGEGSELRYVALDGAPYGMQLHYADRDCQVFADPVASLTQLATELNAPNIERVPLEDYYQLQFAGVQRVADRLAYTIIAVARDELRYPRRLFIDAKTGILLRSEYLTVDGQLLASSQFVAFNDLSEDTPAGERASQPPSSDIVHCESADQQRLRVAAAEQSPWRLEWWPIGFALSDYRRESAGLESFMFSDGLAQFTLFIDPSNRLAVESIGGSRGATSAVIRQLQGQQDPRLGIAVSVVGELPRATAEKILSSVVFAASKVSVEQPK